MTAFFRGHSHRSASNQTTVDGRAPHFRRSASIPQDVILPFAGGRVAERRRRGWSGPRPSDSTRTDITTPSRRRPRPLMPSIPRQPRLQASNGKMLTRRALAQPERDLTAAQREADILNRFDFMAFAEQLSRICRPHCSDRQSGNVGCIQGFGPRRQHGIAAKLTIAAVQPIATWVTRRSFEAEFDVMISTTVSCARVR